MARIALSATVSVSVFVALGCMGGNSGGGLPSWLPAELAGLTVSPASESELRLTKDEAVAAARSTVFIFGGPAEEPDTFPTLVTGRVLPAGTIHVPPDGRVVLPKVEDKPAWLVVWRGIPANLREPPSNRDSSDDHLMDLVVFVDAESGRFLANVSLFGPARLT